MPSLLPGADGSTPPSFARQLVADLRRGRNVDLFAVVTIAVAVAVLGVAGVVDSAVLAAATLAVLAALATSALASRHQVENVEALLLRIAANETGAVPADRFFSSRLTTLDNEVATATDVGLVGVTLTRTVRDLLPVLDRRLEAGARVPVLLIDVESQAREEAVARSRKADTPNFYRHRISSTVDMLRAITPTSTGPGPGAVSGSGPVSGAGEPRLRVRLLPFVPTFGMCLVDPAERHGRIHVEIYQHRSLEPNPSFSLRADQDGHWYELFAAQFEAMWACGREVPLAVTAPGS